MKKENEIIKEETTTTEITTALEKKNLFNLLQTATGLKDAVNIKITIKDVIMSDDICYIISKDDECYATNSSSALKDLKNVIAIFGTYEGITIIPKLKNIGGGKTVIQLFIDW